MSKKKTIDKGRLLALIGAATGAISCDWEPCNEENIQECRGKDCGIGQHRAMAYMEVLRKLVIRNA